MIIVYNDGSKLECHTIEVSETELFVDEYRIVPVADISHIED